MVRTSLTICNLKKYAHFLVLSLTSIYKEGTNVNDYIVQVQSIRKRKDKKRAAD